MNTVAFTSEFVCNNLARKVVLGMEAMATENAKQFADGLLIPIAERLSSGKMARGTLEKMLDRTIEKLEAAPNVVTCTYDAATRKKLSSNELHHLTYILANNVNQDWVGFVVTEMTVSRRSFEVTSTTADIRIHRHALARYMNRELKPTDEMLSGIEDALMASTLLSHAVAESDSENIAIPMQDGMLFGRVRVINAAMSPPTRMRFTFKNHKPTFTEENRDTLHERFRVVVEIMTYVDWNSLTQPRIELHKAVTAFMDKHRFGMRQCFNIAYFESAIMDEDQKADVYPTITTALAGARALVKSPEWKQYGMRG